ncbi:MAG: trypsin-like serine protease [Pseudomonadota bacterium]
MAQQQDGERRLLQTQEEALRWAGVGLLQIAGSSCTGALIAPRLVLTAAHCLYDRSGNLASPERVVFLAGWRRQRAVAERRAQRLIAHRDYDPGARYGRDNIQVDIGLVELDEPIPSSIIRPFERLDRLTAGDPVGLVSYGRGRFEAPSLQAPCRTLRDRGRILEFSCEAVPGTSGAPIFVSINSRPRIASLVSGSRSSGSRQTTLGVELGVALRDVMTDLAGGVPRGGSFSRSWDTGRVAQGPATPVAPPATVGSTTGFIGSGEDTTGRKVVLPPSQ